MPGFRYFERIDEDAGSYAFWEICVDGPTLQLRSGPVGTAGKHESETCASETTAQRELDLRIAAQIEAGYRECADRRLDERTRALEAAIEADPDDVSAFLVYADWIQTLGDPRGALIVAQLADDPAARTRADAYLAQHAPLFLGELANHTGYTGAPFDLTWKSGFIRSAKVRTNSVSGPLTEGLFEYFLRHPSVRWLDELAISSEPLSSISQIHIDVLAHHPLTSVRTFSLGDVGDHRDQDEPYQDRFPADLRSLWRSLATCRRVSITGDPAEVGELALPACEQLAIETAGPSPWTGALGAAHLPAIERLELSFTWPPPTAAELRPMLDAFGRRLDHLTISAVTDTDALCTLLAQLRRPSLRTLQLAHAGITDDAAEILAASGLSLEILDVSHNLLTYRGIALLERIAQLVIADYQNPRY